MADKGGVLTKSNTGIKKIKNQQFVMHEKYLIWKFIQQQLNVTDL